MPDPGIHAAGTTIHPCQSFHFQYACMSKISCQPDGAGNFYPEDSPLTYGKPGLSVQHGHIVRMQNPGKLLIGPLHAGCYNSSRPIWKQDENAGHLRGTGRIQDSDTSYSLSAGGKHHKLLLATS